jgi:hypothetical protein
MSTGDEHVSTAREQLAHPLKEARVNAGFNSHGKLATAMRVSRPVVVRAESASGPVPTDDTLIGYANATGVDLAGLKDLAKRCKNGTPEWFMPYLAAEQVATRLQFYAVSVVPGLLQTEDYAMAHERSEAVVRQRMDRQLKVIGRAQVTAVLDHRCLVHAIGSAKIMADQCAHLIDLAETEKIRLHVVPPGGNVGLAGPVAIASHKGLVTVNMGTFTRDITSTAPDVVDETLLAFDVVLGASLATAPSLEFVRTQEETWRTQV